MLILGINGSPHREGIGAGLLAEALLGAESMGAETDSIHLVDHIKEFPPADYGKDVPEWLMPIKELMLCADGIIFSTPVHWFNMSAYMKAFLDLITPLELPANFPLRGKVAGLIATCDEDGGQQALSLMATPLIHLGFVIPPFGMVFRNNTVTRSEADWQERDVRLLGKNVCRMCRIIPGSKWGYAD